MYGYAGYATYDYAGYAEFGYATYVEFGYAINVWHCEFDYVCIVLCV